MACEQEIVVSIILVNYNGAGVIVDCLSSLRRWIDSISYEVIVVDNASTDGSPELVTQYFPEVLLIKQTENCGFGAGNNVGAKLAKGKFLFLLNTDTFLISDILPQLIDTMQNNPTIGIIGPKLLNPDGSLQISVAPAISIRGEYRALQQAREHHQLQKQDVVNQKLQQLQVVDIVVGAAFFIRKSLFERLGGFDERFFMYFEESDLCQRARDAGWQIVYHPQISLVHLKGQAAQQIFNRILVEYRRSQVFYYQKHRPLWEQLLLRFYLIAKFSISFLRSPNPFNREVIFLVLDFHRYPLNFKLPQLLSLK